MAKAKKKTKKTATKKAATKKVAKKVTKKIAKKTASKKKAVKKKIAKKAVKKSAKKTTKRAVAKKTTGKGKKKVAAKRATKKTLKRASVKKGATNKKSSKKKISKKKTVKKTATKKTATKKAIKKTATKKAVTKKTAKKFKGRNTKKTSTQSSLFAEKVASALKTSPIEKKESIDELSSVTEFEEEVVLTDSEGRRYCRAKECDQISMVEGYCRYHYLSLWKMIQTRRKILSDDKLEEYIVKLTMRYSDKIFGMIWNDMCSEKNFWMAVQDMSIDSGANRDEENFESEAKSFINEVHGVDSKGDDEENSF